MINLLPTQQPVSREGLRNLQEFLHMLADKDIQAYGLCFVHRDGSIHEIHSDAEDVYKLNAAVDFLSARVKG